MLIDDFDLESTMPYKLAEAAGGMDNLFDQLFTKEEMDWLNSFQMEE